MEEKEFPHNDLASNDEKFYLFNEGWLGPYPIEKIQELLKSRRLFLTDVVYLGDFKTPKRLKDLLQEIYTDSKDLRQNPKYYRTTPLAQAKTQTSAAGPEKVLSIPKVPPIPKSIKPLDQLELQGFRENPLRIEAQSNKHSDVFLKKPENDTIPDFEEWQKQKEKPPQELSKTEENVENPELLENLPEKRKFSLLRFLMKTLLFTSGMVAFFAAGLLGTQYVLEYLDPPGKTALQGIQIQSGPDLKPANLNIVERATASEPSDLENEPDLKSRTTETVQSAAHQKIQNTESESKAAVEPLAKDTTTWFSDFENLKKIEISGLKEGYPQVRLKITKPYTQIAYLLQSLPNKTLSQEKYLQAGSMQVRYLNWIVLGPFHAQEKSLPGGQYHLTLMGYDENQQSEVFYENTLIIGDKKMLSAVNATQYSRYVFAQKESLFLHKKQILERLSKLEEFLKSVNISTESIKSPALYSDLMQKKDLSAQWEFFREGIRNFKNQNGLIAQQFFNAEIQWINLIKDFDLALKMAQYKGRNWTDEQIAFEFSNNPSKAFKEALASLEVFKNLSRNLDPNAKTGLLNAKLFFQL